MTTMKKMSIVEIHLAIPKQSITTVAIAELARVGFKKAKYFLLVRDIREEGVSCNLETPPTGHDLADPGMMFTVKVTDIEKGIALVKAGMTVLRTLGIQGNFEIEGQFGESFVTYRDIEMSRELSGYTAIKDAPAFENHIVWRGTTASLPSHEMIVAFIARQFGFTPHQIVDFSRVEVPGSLDTISRVATVYQPNAAAVQSFSTALTLDDAMPPYAYEIGEKVMVVGE